MFPCLCSLTWNAFYVNLGGSGWTIKLNYIESFKLVDTWDTRNRQKVTFDTLQSQRHSFMGFHCKCIDFADNRQIFNTYYYTFHSR